MRSNLRSGLQREREHLRHITSGNDEFSPTPGEATAIKIMICRDWLTHRCWLSDYDRQLVERLFSMESPGILIAQGAEARVWEGMFLGRPCIIKERFPKAYRLPELDAKLTPKRVVQEVRCLARCARAGVIIPCIYLVDVSAHRIYMEKILGFSLKDFLRQHYDEAQCIYAPVAHKLVVQLGRTVAMIHDADMVHGDLTTSNFMVRGESGAAEGHELVAIDFGLGYTKPLPEDKAVDLYVLERAFVSTHPNSQPLVDEVLKAYKATSRRGAPPVLAKLEGVRKRGRKRDMFG